MEGYEGYVESEGTRSNIIESIMQECGLDQEYGERCLSFIKKNQEILSSDEFFQYSRLEEYEIQGISEFVSEEGRYYISLKKSTIFLVVLYLECTIPNLKKLNKIPGFMGMPGIGKGYMKLDDNQGYLCIMLELARNRKKGAGKDLLKKYNGECCNNHLHCMYNDNGLCRCSADCVEKICEDFVKNGVVKKRGKKYYYIF